MRVVSSHAPADHNSAVLLGYVLGPLVENKFCALLLSNGRLIVFTDNPICAFIIGACVLPVVGQRLFALRRAVKGPRQMLRRQT